MKTFEQFVSEKKIEPTHVCTSDEMIPSILLRNSGLKSFVGCLVAIEKLSSNAWNDVISDHEINILDKDGNLIGLFTSSMKKTLDTFRPLTQIEKTSMKYGV